MTAATLRTLRRLHLYAGMFFAPAILFFAVSGGLQSFRLQQASGWGGAPPPQWMAVMGSVHIDQRLPEAKKPEAEKPKPPADPAKEAARKARAQKALPMKIFTAALAAALSLSTLLGIGIALGTRSTRRPSLLMLGAGCLLPLLLLA